MTPYEKLDEVLEMMSTRGVYTAMALDVWYDRLSSKPPEDPGNYEKFEEFITKAELQEILMLLEKEGYVQIISINPFVNSQGSNISEVFKITFKGNYFIYGGGYSGEDLKLAEQNEKFLSLEKQTQENQRWILRLTVVAAVGVLPPALLALADLYWKYEWFCWIFGTCK